MSDNAKQIAALGLAFTAGAVVTFLTARALAPDAVAKAVLEEIDHGSSLRGLPPEVRQFGAAVYRQAAWNITRNAVRKALTPF